MMALLRWLAMALYSELVGYIFIYFLLAVLIGLYFIRSDLSRVL